MEHPSLSSSNKQIYLVVNPIRYSAFKGCTCSQPENTNHFALLTMNLFCVLMGARTVPVSFPRHTGTYKELLFITYTSEKIRPNLETL